MSQNNYGFTGSVPHGVSVEDNVIRALQYQSTHAPDETAVWFYEIVRNNKDGRLSPGVSMDYKQIGKQYADFGNFNYAVVAKALGFPDSVTELGAGVAQGKANGLTLGEAVLRAALDPLNRGDNPEDQRQIEDGIHAADVAGISRSDLGIKAYLLDSMRSALETPKNIGHWIDQNLPTPQEIRDSADDFLKATRAWFEYHNPFDSNNLDALQNMFRRAFDNKDIDNTKENIDHAQSTSSPIILDFDGDGVEVKDRKSVV